MKPSDYTEESPACELLRAHLRKIYSPIDWEKVNSASTDLTTESIDMTEQLHSARAAARVLEVPLSRVLKAIHGKIIAPKATTSGQVIITPSDLETLRKHLIK